MSQCKLCGTPFDVPKSAPAFFKKDNVIMGGVCPGCYEKTWNIPVTKESQKNWGRVLGRCLACDKPYYQKDLDKSEYCTCGTKYTANSTTYPQTLENWLKAIKATAVDAYEENIPEALVIAINDPSEDTVSSALAEIEFSNSNAELAVMDLLHHFHFDW